MFKVKVLSIGKSKEEWLKTALAEYEKRLLGRLAIEWHFVKKDEEMLDWPKNEPLIALDPKGKLFSSEEWSEKVGKLGSKFTFVIGGPDGLCEQMRARADFIWSLSPLTFTHQMTRLILLEQLYRALEIEKGSSYHRQHENRGLRH